MNRFNTQGRQRAPWSAKYEGNCVFPDSTTLIWAREALLLGVLEENSGNIRSYNAMFLVGTCAGVLFGKKKHHPGSNTANQGPRGALWGALWYNNEEGARSDVALR